MAEESVKDFYNSRYSAHVQNRTACPNAIHDLAKACRRVDGVVAGFGLGDLHGRSVLDVGSGLGYYTKALSLRGADVLGLDFSEAAVSAAEQTFPGNRFQCGSWPSDVPAEATYDVVWMVNFSMMNTFDVGTITHDLVDEAMRRLVPGGVLVVGWNTDFSGRTVEGYSHWPIEMLREMRTRTGLSTPLVTAARSMPVSALAIRYARFIRRSIPIFMVKRKAA